MSMRDYLNIMETIGETGLLGSLDTRGLLKFLPEITNPTQFMSAINKIKRGDMERITRPEMTQLALAFISLLGDANEERMKAVRKLATLKPGEQEEQNPMAGTNPMNPMKPM